MKSLQKIIMLTLLGCLFSTSLFSQKSKAEAAQERAEDARDKVTTAAEKIQEIAADCPELTAEQMRKIYSEMEKAKAELAKAKAEAEKATAAALKASAKEKADATAAAKAAEAAVTAAEEALAEAIADVPGIRAANKIKAELDGVDVTDHSEKEKMRKALQDEATKAGYENPCDSHLVRKAVEKKLAEFQKKYTEKNNRTLHEWLQEVEKKLDGLVLVSAAPLAHDGAWVSRPAAGPRFLVELFGGTIFTPDDGTAWPLNDLLGKTQQEIYNDPVLLEKLFVRLGGEFFIGDFSEEPKPVNPQASNGWMWGFGTNYAITPNFSTTGSVGFAKHELNAGFPVTVFDFENGETQVLLGQLNVQISSIRAKLGGQYTLGQGTVRPFAGGGIQYARSTVREASANLGGVRIDSGLEMTTKSVGVYGTAGVEVHPSDMLFLRASVFAAREKVETGPAQSGTVWIPGLSIGAGVKF